jgi:hypothetical protein
MSERHVPYLMTQTHVRLATGTMGQPLGGFDVLTGIDLSQFNSMSGGFRFLKRGPFQSDDDVIVDEYYAREKRLNVGSAVTLANHTWRVFAGGFFRGPLGRSRPMLSMPCLAPSTPLRTVLVQSRSQAGWSATLILVLSPVANWFSCSPRGQPA